jgi:hypothetical protein
MRRMRNRTLLPLALFFFSACGTSMPPGDNGGVDMANNPLPADLGLQTGDVVLKMTPFTVPAGQEVFMCQNFANPFGADADIREFESHMSTGSHHLLIFYKQDATDDPVAACSGLEFSAGPYGAQTPDAVVTYPDGVAALIPKNQGLRFASHYLNATTSDITANVEVILRKADPATVKNQAGIFFFNNVNFIIPPTGAPYTITKDCVAPQDMTIMYSVGHMHQHATELTAMLDGQMIYDTTSWSASAFKQYQPTLSVKAGQKFTFSCTYVNKTGGPLIFGESALNNEMCIFDGQYYPNTTNGINCM